MKKLISLLFAVMLCFVLVSCGGPDREPAIDAFNAANTAFTEIATTINADIEAYDEEVVDVMIEMADLLAQHKALLEGDDELSQEKLDEMIAWYDEVITWADSVKAELGI